MFRQQSENLKKKRKITLKEKKQRKERRKNNERHKPTVTLFSPLLITLF